MDAQGFLLLLSHFTLSKSPYLHYKIKLQLSFILILTVVHCPNLEKISALSPIPAKKGIFQSAIVPEGESPITEIQRRVRSEILGKAVPYFM